MGRTRNKGYTAATYESQGARFTDCYGKTRKDTFCRLYDSLLQSEAFITMTPRQKNLLIYCYGQHMGKRPPGEDYKEVGLFQGEMYFYFPWDYAERMKLYPKGNHSIFYKDMEALEAHGFIEKVASGRNKRMSVYRYASKWQEWTAEK